MVYVYPDTVSTFIGDPQIAINAGYIEVEDSVFKALRSKEKIWQNGEIVDNPNYETVVIDRTAKAAKDAIKAEIAELKRNLAMSDYKAIKFAEGQITKTDYAPIKAERQGWRDRINELEISLQEEN